MTKKEETYVLELQKKINLIKSIKKGKKIII